MGIFSMFEQAVQKKPFKTAVIYNTDSLTYNELYNRVLMFSAYLSKKGVHSGSKVAIYERQGINFIVQILSLARIGAIIIPINTHITNEDVMNTIKFIDIDYIIISKSIYERAYEFGAVFEQIICSNGVNDEKIISTEANNDKPFVYITTSGSTGKPKVVEISATAMHKRIETEKLLFNLTEEDVILVSMPLYHACGFRMSLTAIVSGMTLVVLNGFTPKRWYDAVVTNKVTYTIAVPTQLTKIVSWCTEEKLEHTFDNLTHLSSASAFLSEKLRKDVLKIYGGRFYNMYASSETDFVALTLCKNEDDINILGRIVPNEYVIIDKNAEHDKYGEICCHSNWLFTRYVNDKLLNENTRIGDCFRTGDLGSFKDNILYYCGRKKNIIISGGINIVPDDIESKILELPGVEDCIVYGEEDPILGEAVCVSVKLSANSNVDIKEIRKHCLQRLADFQQPRKIELTTSIKRNSMGKIIR